MTGSQSFAESSVQARAFARQELGIDGFLHECVAEGELISANICMNESEAVYTMLQEFLSATFYGFVMRLKNPI